MWLRTDIAEESISEDSMALDRSLAASGLGTVAAVLSATWQCSRLTSQWPSRCLLCSVFVFVSQQQRHSCRRRGQRATVAAAAVLAAL